MSTPTPRTDAKLPTVAERTSPHYLPEMVYADFARTLERELIELLAVNATGAARLAHTSAQLAAEREKVRALRLACERIVNQWDADHDANPIGAGGRMYSLASKVLAATESENGGSNE